MVQGRANMMKITRGLRNKEIVDGTIEVSYSPERLERHNMKKKTIKPNANAGEVGEATHESLQQQVLVPTGPRVSDWTYVGSYDSDPPVVKSNTVYEVVRFLARGAFGDVNLVKSIEDSRLYAIKTIFAERESEMREMLREVRFLRMNRHPCIIDVYDGFIISNPRLLYIVMPYCEGGDLDGFIKNTRRNKSNIPEDKVLRWSSQIGLAIHFLHENGLIHRDLKPNNIMLLEGGDLVKVVDFGLAVNMLDTKTKPVEAGTPYYMAPEILQGVTYTYPIDCWSFGVMLHEMLRLDLPFRGKSTADLVRSILEDEAPPVPPHYSSGIKAIAAALLIKDPKQRMGMAGMLTHPLLYPKTSTFPQSYRPKQVEERIRRSQVKQLYAQIDIMPRSRHSSLMGVQALPAEAPVAVTTEEASSSSVGEANGDRDEEAMPEAEPTDPGPQEEGGSGTEVAHGGGGGDGAEGMTEGRTEGEEEQETESRKRQQLNAALQTAEELAPKLDAPPVPMADGDEEEDDW